MLTNSCNAFDSLRQVIFSDAASPTNRCLADCLRRKPRSGFPTLCSQFAQTDLKIFLSEKLYELFELPVSCVKL